MPYSDNAKNAMLNHLGTLAAFASLHSANPGAGGASEIAGGAPAYARKAATWNAAAAGNLDLSNAPVFDIPSVTTIAFLGFWSLLTGGTFYGWAPLGGGTRIHFNVDDIATDLLDAGAHGFVNGDQVVAFGGTGGLPGGLSEGTIYHVRDVTADTLKLAATAGGAAIDLTSIGNGLLQKIVPETYTAQGTYTLLDADLNLNTA